MVWRVGSGGGVGQGGWRVGSGGGVGQGGWWVGGVGGGGQDGRRCRRRLAVMNRSQRWGSWSS